MGKISVGEQNGSITCSLSFGSVASVSQALSIMLDLENWKEYFPGLIGSARILSGGEMMNTEVEIKVPLLPEKSWTIISRSRLSVENNKVLVDGKNVCTGDWAATEFQLSVVPGVKKNHGCRVEVRTTTPQEDMPVPKPILLALMRFAKPLLKRTLNRLANESVKNTGPPLALRVGA